MRNASWSDKNVKKPWTHPQQFDCRFIWPVGYVDKDVVRWSTPHLITQPHLPEQEELSLRQDLVHHQVVQVHHPGGGRPACDLVGQRVTPPAVSWGHFPPYSGGGLCVWFEYVENTGGWQNLTSLFVHVPDLNLHNS